jgi:hypothetical protein
MSHNKGSVKAQRKRSDREKLELFISKVEKLLSTRLATKGLYVRHVVRYFPSPVEYDLIQPVGGGVIGIALGFGLAQMLVTILTGVFDPPPEVLTVPWIYLALLALAAITSMVAAVLSTQVASRRPVVEALRDL